jgi:hypothetical protein
MATSPVFRPKRPAWFRAFAGAVVVSMLVYGVWRWWTPWRPGRWGGLLFGTLATAVFVVDALYPLRRRLMSWPLQSAQHWLQFHIYGGVLACLFVFIHMGFRLPAGQFGWWLLILSLWATFSGLVGVAVQKYVPNMLATNLAVEAIYERIPGLAARLQGDADRLLVGAPDVLQRAYLNNTRAWLGALAPSWSYVVDFRAERERRLGPFSEVAPFLSDADRARLVDLQAIVAEKLELDVQYSLQRLIKTWVPLHAWPSLFLMGLIAVHVIAVLVF